MGKERSGDASVCWAVMFLLLAFFHHLVASQPQVYFKASLPAKSLPRIGRRSGGEGFPTRPSSASSGSLDAGEAWSDTYAYSPPTSFNYNPHPDAVLLLRKFLAERDFGMVPQDSMNLQAVPSSFYSKLLQDSN